jgi:hypothetical protein
MRVYHFIDQEHGLQNIRLRRLKIATLESVNDPFELMAVASGNPAQRKAFSKFKQDWTERYGILCFSRDWQSPVQWSHYADRHRGICLGFDVKDSLVNKVVYRKTRLPSEILNNFNEKTAQRIMLTKYLHWNYEQEVRVFARLEDRDPAAGLYFRQFDQDLALRDVIVGHRSLLTRQVLTVALGDLAPSVTAFRARLAFNSYRVVKQHDRERWV